MQQNLKEVPSQTARLWDTTTGETRVDFRGHEHVVEAAIFAPANAVASIRELAGLVGSLSHSHEAPPECVN